jgi:hypothetical protein
VGARLQRELELVAQRYGELEVAEDVTWLVIKSLVLPAGWSAGVTRLLLMIPAGYPATPPDNFAIDGDIRLANGGEPGNLAGRITHAASEWLLFSWHVVDGTAGWAPHAEIERGDNLLTFLLGVESRLAEAS